MWKILQPVLGLIIKQIADSITDYWRDRQRIQAETALAVAREQARAAVEARKAQERMAGEALPDDAEVLDLLKKGEA